MIRLQKGPIPGSSRGRYKQVHVPEVIHKNCEYSVIYLAKLWHTDVGMDITYFQRFGRMAIFWKINETSSSLSAIYNEKKIST